MSRTTPCSICGVERQTNRKSLPAGRYTCHGCRRSTRASRPTECAFCQATFTPRRRGRGWTVTCSKSCGMKHSRAQGRGRQATATKLERAHAKSRARRLRKALTWDGIPDPEIMDRDGWRCGICTKKISPALAWPHPMSKSIDHIIPLAQGGDDTAINKRAAHLDCNVRRGDRAQNDQLLLFGSVRDAPLTPSVTGVPRSREPKAFPRPHSTPIYTYACRYCQTIGVERKHGRCREVCRAKECQALRLKDNGSVHSTRTQPART